MLKQRCFNVVYVTRENARPLNLDKTDGQTVEYNGRPQTIALNN